MPLDNNSLITIVQESVYLIAVFVAFVVYATWKGKQSVINLILGLYLALLLSVKFPYYDIIFGPAENAHTQAILMLALFAIFTVLSTLLFNHIMPREFSETAFEGLGKKFLFALGGTVLVMTFSFHVLPVTEFITPGSPIQYLFASEQSFFWWLIAPLVALFLL